MQTPLTKNTLKNESDLLERCQFIEGLSFSQLANQLGLTIPTESLKRKGWAGMAIEIALGACAGSKSLPDFYQLGIELKTLPLNKNAKPAESTFVTSIALHTLQYQIWSTSQCFAKLKRVLWLPIEGEKTLEFEQRRIGRGFLWSPNEREERILANDWEEFAGMITSGQLEKIDATMGQYLQVRPKASNAKSLCYGFDGRGNKIKTLPRGFYLRSKFTEQILANSRSSSC